MDKALLPRHLGLWTVSNLGRRYCDSLRRLGDSDFKQDFLQLGKLAFSLPKLLNG